MMRITTVRPNSHTTEIRVEGRVEAATLQVLRDSIARTCEAEEPGIVLCLEGLTGIDAAGTRYLKELGSTVTIVKAPEFLRLQLAADSARERD